MTEYDGSMVSQCGGYKILGRYNTGPGSDKPGRQAPLGFTVTPEFGPALGFHGLKTGNGCGYNNIMNAYGQNAAGCGQTKFMKRMCNNVLGGDTNTYVCQPKTGECQQVHSGTRRTPGQKVYTSKDNCVNSCHPTNSGSGRSPN